MQLHQIKRKTPNKKKKLVGRGGKRGTTSGRGTKGQLARSGRKLRPEFRDVIKRIPKLRGYRFNSIQKLPVIVKISSLDKSGFKNGDTVSPKTLLALGLVTVHKGKIPKIKILGDGEISKKLNIEDCAASKSAKEAILKAGGSVK